jgi:L-asparaginase II
MARYADVKLEDLEYGVDGCGVPTWWLDLKSIATASARYGDPDFTESKLETSIKERVFEAYHKAAWYTAGTGRFGTPFNSESDGKWLGKIGGEAVFGVSLRHIGLGIGIKVMDGNSRALGPALLYAMRKWDLLTDDQYARLEHRAVEERYNAPGTLIGWMRPVEHY